MRFGGATLQADFGGQFVYCCSPIWRRCGSEVQRCRRILEEGAVCVLFQPNLEVYDTGPPVEQGVEDN